MTRKMMIVSLMMFMAVAAFGNNFDRDDSVSGADIINGCIPPLPILQGPKGMTCIDITDETEMDGTITGYDEDGLVLCQVTWQCVEPQIVVTYSDGQNTLQYTGEAGAENTSVFYNGRYMDISDVPDAGRALIQTGSDMVGSVVADGDCVTDALNEKQRRAMNTICYVAGIGVGFWPIGTLIAGPTALGCAIMYARGDL